MFQTDLISTVLSPFLYHFSRPLWIKVHKLVIGTFLCIGPRRISTILRVLGLNKDRGYCRFHRVLNRDKWNSLACAKTLLQQLISRFVKSGKPLLMGIDETLERRKGKKIQAKGWYRDGVRSKGKKVVTTLGLKWIVMSIIVSPFGGKRPWSLPFFTVLAPSKKANEERRRAHKTIIDWAILIVNVCARWLNRPFILLGDGGYACVRFAHACVKQNITLIARLRLDSRLYDDPPAQPPGRRGRKPQLGERLFLKNVQENTQAWQEAEVKWYNGELKNVSYKTGINIWKTNRQNPIKVRWVIVKTERGCSALFSTNLTLSAPEIIAFYVQRWNLEVTFEEARAHLGVETQRQWSNRAIARTTPVLFGLYSLAALIGVELKKYGALNIVSSAWYKKKEVTFSDVIAHIRRHIWAGKNLTQSRIKPNFITISNEVWENALYQLTASP